MKQLLITISIVLLGLPVLAQEVQFPSAIISAGGGSLEDNPISFSRWRIGQVNVVTFPDDMQIDDPDGLNQDWSVFILPDPVEDFLYLEFVLPEEDKEMFIKIYDVSGRVVFIQEARTFTHGSTDEIDMSGYKPALYFLQISSPDLSSQRFIEYKKYS
jgi:hypothetical protein